MKVNRRFAVSIILSFVDVLVWKKRNIEIVKEQERIRPARDSNSTTISSQSNVDQFCRIVERN